MVKYTKAQKAAYAKRMAAKKKKKRKGTLQISCSLQWRWKPHDATQSA